MINKAEFAAAAAVSAAKTTGMKLKEKALGETSYRWRQAVG